MKKTAIILILWAMMLCLFSANVCAEEALTAPVVQYKLIDHDRIVLRWDAVEGADGYYIYRTDVKMGKTFRYPSAVNKTENTIGRLSPDTEYIFSVAPIKKNGNKIIVGKRSSGTKLTTPKKWYYYNDYVIDDNRKTMKSYYYKTDYSKGKKEKFSLGDIKYVDEIIYYDSWYYVIGNLNAIDSDPYPYGQVNNRMCIARIKEDGTQKEILFDDFYHADDIQYYYIITDDAIYLRQKCFNTYEENDKELYYYDAELCWLKKISLKTGEVRTIASPCLYSWFDIHDGYMYYGYDDIYTFNESSKEFYTYGNQGIYISAWYDSQTGKMIDSEKYNSYCYMMKENSKTRQLIYKSVYDKRIFDAYIYNSLKVFEESNSICTMSMNNNNYKKIFSSNDYISIIDIKNDYIYFSESNGPDSNKKYGRIKIDGTGLEKKDKPFEWFY